MPKRTVTLGVMASGRGTNLQSILDAIAAGRLDAKIALVLSDREDAQALDRARAAGVPARHLNPKAFPSREAHDAAAADLLRGAGVELVALAGYMRLITRALLDAFPDRIINIHPSLLPAFTGLNAQRQAIEYGVKLAGCTVHFVTEGVDSGAIILQAAVPVRDDDTEATLAERILAEEHRLLPEALQLYAEGRVSIEGRRVRIAPPASVGL
ncbi:MAG TPA: phosphoribosylglycinamide formyltransferase [Nitrospiria bacterium]|nr:phosphoribosylglycinamide formyltransferase [Nitrospiria bacterium]